MGPMRRVSGSAKITFPKRTITSQPLHGTEIEVQTPTHLAGTVDFQNGAIATVIMSFDMWGNHLPRIEIYGTEGTLAVPDPNGTGGTVLLRRAEHREWRDMPLTHAAMPHRGAAVADLAHAIREGRAPRASGEMAQHIVDAMQAFEDSSRAGRHVELSTCCVQPAPLQPGLAKGVIA
jgi:predicted dehydrogenase